MMTDLSFKIFNRKENKTMNNNLLQVTIKNVYGVERIYPYCPKSEVFAILTNSRTLSENDVKRIKTLGYGCEIVNNKKV